MAEAGQQTENFGGNNVEKGNVAGEENHGDENDKGRVNQFLVFLEAFDLGIVVPRP